MKTLNFETLPSIKLPLVQRFYKQHYPSAKAKKDETIIVGRDHQDIIAVVRFRKIDDVLLLTGMCVAPHHRGQGLGHQLLSHCQQTLLSSQVYCFALSHLVGFYSKHRFNPLEPHQLPNSLKLLYRRYTQHGKNLIPMQYL